MTILAFGRFVSRRGTIGRSPRARRILSVSRRHTANRRDVVFEGDVDVDVDALDALDARRVQASRDAVAAQSRDAESDARVGRGVGVERARGGGAEG